MDILNSFNALKKHVFYELMNIAGRVFILVKYSDDVVIGSRGFLSEERENGIILVFNSRMRFHWDDYGITATLVFGTSPQKCFIPTESIIAIYSPDIGAQFVLSGHHYVSKKPKLVDEPDDPDKSTDYDSKKLDPTIKSKVIKVDFENKKRFD